MGMADENEEVVEGAAPETEEKGVLDSAKDVASSAYTLMTDWNGDGKTTIPELLGTGASLFVGGPLLKIGATLGIQSAKFVATKVLVPTVVKTVELGSNAAVGTAKIVVAAAKNPVVQNASLVGAGVGLHSLATSSVSDASADTLDNSSTTRDDSGNFVKVSAHGASGAADKSTTTTTGKIVVEKEAFSQMLDAAGYKDNNQLKNRLTTAKDEDLSEKEDGKIEVSAATQKWLAEAAAHRAENQEAQRLLKELGYELKFGDDGKAYDGGETLTALEKAKAELKINAKSTVIDFDGEASAANAVSPEMLDGLRHAVAEKKSKSAGKSA